jgi:carbonic anhydrase
VELNVVEQVQKLAQTSMVQHAWKRERRPTIHGWVYDLRTGYLKDIARVDPNSHLEDIYVFNWPEEEQPGA